ncbi:MAG: hypothetical protein ACREQ2_26125 [Candidatus Binatia bacterium]
MSKDEPMALKADNISLADEEAVKQVLVNSVLGLWDVVNHGDCISIHLFS